MDFITIGEMVIDFIPGQEEASYIRNAGGAPANVAIAAARNGLEAGIYCKVGEDDFGRFLLKTLRENHVTPLAPEMAKDTDSAADSSVVEILLGQTNRPESALPDAGEHDAWVYVGIRGNKLVINGSNAYMLEQAVNHFISECLPAEGGAYTFESGSNYQTLRADWQADGWLLNELP